jgi:hypothetical protein
MVDIKINMEYNGSIMRQIIEGYKLADNFDETNENGLYWTDGKKVYFRHYEIKGADIKSFLQYPGCWAIDKNHCYTVSDRIRDADKETFQPLNYTYAKDKLNVWTLGGKIKDVDAETFEVCDSGKYSLGNNIEKGKRYEIFVPYGFGKDKNNVYHYDYSGKPNIVKNASPNTFVSLGDCVFGYDENNVYYKQNKLNKANPKTWKLFKTGYLYSKDKYIYYLNRIIKDADLETFEIIEQNVEFGLPFQYARDKNNFYNNDNIITKEKYEEDIKEK